jgi:hypothetical protein
MTIKKTKTKPKNFLIGSIKLAVYDLHMQDKVPTNILATRFHCDPKTITNAIKLGNLLSNEELQEARGNKRVADTLMAKGQLKIRHERATILHAKTVSAPEQQNLPLATVVSNNEVVVSNSDGSITVNMSKDDANRLIGLLQGKIQ